MMDQQTSGRDVDNAMEQVLLWDLAGTLLVRDGHSHRTGPLPGWDTALPSLARDFRMVVSTGEESRSARSLLSEFGLLPYFEEIFGDLLGYGGKPHGEILRQLGGQPRRSLVIGDRLRGDLPADCDELVTLLVNQEGEVLNAELIGAVIRDLHALNPDHLEAFRELSQRAEPDPEALGPYGGGIITAAWNCDELSGARLWIFEPDWLDARRPVILI